MGIAPNGDPPGLLARLAPSPRQLRTELDALVAKELLGPRGGPDEEVTERLLDRYLVGLLAPKNKLIRASEMDTLAEDGEGSVEDGATDDSAPPSDSLYPSSIGLTCTVAGDVHEILVIARWGRYARERSATLTTAQGNPTVVWKRYPMGNVGRNIALAEGAIASIPITPPRRGPWRLASTRSSTKSSRAGSRCPRAGASSKSPVSPAIPRTESTSSIVASIR